MLGDELLGSAKLLGLKERLSAPSTRGMTGHEAGQS